MTTVETPVVNRSGPDRSVACDAIYYRDPFSNCRSHRRSGTVGNSYSRDSVSKAIRSWKEPFKTQLDHDLRHGVCEYYVLGVIPAPSTAISES